MALVPDIPTVTGIPPEYADWPVVALNPPPAVFLEATHTMIRDAVAKLGDEKGRLIWIATEQPGGKPAINLALVNKLNDHVNVTAWIGKEWGKPVAAGVAGEIHW